MILPFLLQLLNLLRKAIDNKGVLTRNEEMQMDTHDAAVEAAKGRMEKAWRPYLKKPGDHDYQVEEDFDCHLQYTMLRGAYSEYNILLFEHVVREEEYCQGEWIDAEE